MGDWFPIGFRLYLVANKTIPEKYADKDLQVPFAFDLKSIMLFSELNLCALALVFNNSLFPGLSFERDSVSSPDKWDEITLGSPIIPTSYRGWYTTKQEDNVIYPLEISLEENWNFNLYYVNENSSSDVDLTLILNGLRRS